MAKYRITPSSKAIIQLPISIGHKAEKGVEAIEFDLTAWVETYGSGTLTVIMRRWGDAIPYPIALEIDENNKATWTLSDTDTAKAGMAYAQLNYIVGDEVVKKSDIYTFRVMDSLTGEGEPPEAYESWLEHLTHLAAEAMAEVLDIEGIVTDKTLTVDGGIADGKATGDALSALEDQFSEETDKLKADLGAQVDMLGEYEAVTEVTENLDISNSGLTLQATEDGRVKIFGTATAIRNYGFLNGQNFIATSTSTLIKTLDAGTYVIEHGITGSQERYAIRGTYSTFANWFIIASAGASQKTVVTFEQDVTIAFASPIDRDYGTEENASYLTFKASKVTSKDEKARADLSAMAETVGDIEQTLAKSGVYDFEGVETSGFGIAPAGIWSSSSIAKSHVVKIPKGTRSIAITANSEQTAMIAFLNSYSPVAHEQVDFSEGYSARIVINAGESDEYEIENGMNYLYVLITDISSNDHTPSVTMTYPATLTLPTDQSDNDRSGEISALLNVFGLCVLEKGTYSIGKSIKMHDSSRLEGHGSAIILSNAVTDGSAIIMDSNCTITGIVLSGGLTSAPSTEGTRNGIEWTGKALLTSYIDKCVITGFSGSGIFLHDTTAKTYRNLLITNCRVTACFIGIDIRRNSEFNRVSNCTIIANRYGIRSRGGNNHIGNCGLDANYCGILVDMDEGSNGGHGGIANCTINHSNHDSGYGLIIKDTGRMLITACNFYFSKIKLENTNGNIINGCGFGNSTGWEINGGGCSLFINCMVVSAAQTPVTITDNTAIKIVNCYTRDGDTFAA